MCLLRGKCSVTCRTIKGLSLLKDGERDGVSLLFSRSVDACWFRLILSSCSSTLILVLPTSRSPNPDWSTALLGRSYTGQDNLKFLHDIKSEDEYFTYFYGGSECFMDTVTGFFTWTMSQFIMNLNVNLQVHLHHKYWILICVTQ